MAGGGLAVRALHGGCGATTVARLLGARESFAPGAVVVAAARTNLRGAEGVRAMLADPPAGRVLLVLTADAPLGPPPPVRAAVLEAADLLAGVHLLPYVPLWRGSPATAATATAKWRRAAEALRAEAALAVDGFI